MVVYESKPTVALASSSPSGSRTTAASDGFFIFTVSADSQEKVQFRAGSQNVADVVTLWSGTNDNTSSGNVPASVITADTGVKIQGVASIKSDPHTGDIIETLSYAPAAATDLSGYARVSFWARTDGAATTAQVSFGVSEGAATLATTTETSALSSALTAGVWVFQDVALSTTVANRDAALAYGLVVTAGLGVNELLYIDDIRFYNEKITVNLASDSSLAVVGTSTGVLVNLKEGGSTVATGYVYATSQSAASVTFVPTVAIEISKGTSKTFTVEANTTTLISDLGGTDDLLTASIVLGSSTGGTPDAGGLWWNETNATVKWLGHVDNTTLNGNTLKY